MLKSGRFQTSVSIAIVALCLAATPAMAQGTGDSKDAPPAPPRANGQIAPTTQGADLVVTASRIAKAGYNAPTPVTVVSAEQIKQTAPNDIADALSTLPAFRGLSNRSVDTGTSANGNAGASLLNLRGLGANRTLVLLDGRRVVSSNVSGSTDVNLMPQNLVRSVDVVTGGASAAYGSDAVAGVVNFVLDTKFEGVKAEMQGGISRYGDAGSYRGTIAAGHGFADGRGRVIASLEYFHKNGISTYSTARPWRNDVSAWIPNATGVTTPARVLANGITYSGRSYGGLILNGALKGTDFTANGTPTPFIYGSTVSSVFMAGGDGPSPVAPFGASVDRINGFLHAEYDITDNWTLFGEGTLSRSHTPFEQYYNYNAGSNALTIYSGNPYIPAAIQSQMTAQGIASFTLGKYWSNLPENVADNYSTTQRFVGGLNGKLGGDWTAKAYFTHGQSQLKVFDRNILNNRNIYAATDAVVNPANGQIVCRSTLNGLDPGCTPINPFGTGAINAATAAYVTGDSWRYLKLTQDVAAVNVQGSLPDWAALWSKPASLAVGAEWRRETANQTSDAVSQAINNFAGLRGAASSQSGTLGGFYASNPQPISGRVTVKELYGELALPVAADRPFIKALDLNAAVRLTDYSTSGQVVTWKLGGVWKPVQGLTLRLTRSRDIRAPNILELFSGGVAGNATVIDPKTGATVPFLGYTRGNPDLKPEKANTLTFGMVVQPAFLRGFDMSVDYYDIKISAAIASLSAQDTINQCAAGATVVCSQIQFTNGTYYLNLLPFNLASARNSGLDIEAGYRFGLLGGRVTLRALGNLTTRNVSQAPGAAPIDRAREAGQFNGTLTAAYDRGTFSAFVQERYISAGLYNAQYVTGVDIDRNHVPGRLYTDVTLKNKLRGVGRDSEVFVTVNNLFNVKPPVLSTVSSFILQSNYSMYDPIGTYITAGFRTRF